MDSESQSRHENGNTSGSRRAKKRRLVEVGDAEPAAKRRRESSVGDGGSEESEVERSSGVKNENTQDGTREKEKKKRRKKKKKVPVVQQPHQQDGSPAKQKMSSSSRTTAPSATLKPNGKQKDKKRKQKEKEPTPGPSRLARSRSRSSSLGRDGGEDIGEGEGGQENESVTLDSAAPSLKGKQRASSPSSSPSHSSSHSPSHSNPTATEVETLTKKLDSITQTIFPSLICNICLYLMHRPFLLSPCGHVACLDCLVSWFSSEVPGQGQLMPQVEEQEQPQQEQENQENQHQENQQQHNQPGMQPDPIYDAAGEVFDWVIPPPPIAIPPPPQIPLAIPPPPFAIPPPPLAIPPPPQLPPLPPAPRPRPLAKRKKTCPQCRARITTRPVEVWFAKDMVASIVRAGVVDLDAVPPSLRPGAPVSNAVNGNVGVEEADPWKDIFPNKSKDGRRTRERELLREMRERERMGDRDDADGGVYRCVDCMTEIWEGVCAECGRVYRGHLPGGGMSEFSDDFSDEGSEGSDGEGEGDTDDDLGFMLGLHPNLRYLSESGSEGEGGFYGMPVQVTWTDDEMEPSDAGGSGSEGSESEGYESSFIDDGEREVVELVGSSDDEGEGEGEGERDAPRMRRAGRVGRRSNPYVISSAEEDESGGESPPVRRLGRRDGGVIEVLSDEDEDEGSDNGGGDLAAEVAERERELYGDDGSVPSGRLRSRHAETGGGEDGWASDLSDETTSVVEGGGVDYMDDDEEDEL